MGNTIYFVSIYHLFLYVINLILEGFSVKIYKKREIKLISQKNSFYSYLLSIICHHH